MLGVHSDPDGVSKLFAAAQDLDVVDISGQQPPLMKRTTRLETRNIGSGHAYSASVLPDAAIRAQIKSGRSGNWPT